jgi:DNA-binding GntR family transcriptional regulator
MTRVPNRTRADRLRDDIAQAIIEGELSPGDRLDEIGLAARFGVSRTPVREALKHLAGIELVELRPHRGAVVAALHEARIGELFEALAECEAACARLAALKMASGEVGRLDELHATCADALRRGDQALIPEANRLFHEAIYAGAHNGFLSGAVLNLRRRLAPFSRAQFRLEQRPLASRREHAVVMEAIRARDGDGAEAAMRRHVLAVGRAWQAVAADSASSQREQAEAR